MFRRDILTGLAVASAALVAAPALAQDAMKSDGMAMGEAEMKHDKDTATVGSLSLATSRIALEKAKGAKVKEFAEFETAEQETIADILMSMKKPAGEAQGALMKPSEAEVEAMLDAMGKETVAKMKAAPAGTGFDKEYVTAQLDGHKKLLAIQEDYLKVGRDREHLSVAKLARGQIREHIKLLEDIQSMMG